ncbi:hypothetical protein IMZ31_22255 (plasmid) [Pontibacillus sp. ALD_SL1]|uniref:hypothetical protein n=1 Tax=Pontibacillus sp. ALD_SL1 TaxID=2777185 RepID=UPI001A97BF6C|nr:hypothetical protein [Pontibacillus sp. ALD_SL1]QST02178.1 hypothetical protein IMZ31_22255 [Pontibacillus sp. ALD_SL1]
MELGMKLHDHIKSGNTVYKVIRVFLHRDEWNGTDMMYGLQTNLFGGEVICAKRARTVDEYLHNIGMEWERYTFPIATTSTHPITAQQNARQD